MKKITLEEIIERDPPPQREEMFERIYNCDYLSMEEKGCFLVELQDDEIFNKWGVATAMMNYVYHLYLSKDIPRDKIFYQFYNVGLNHPNWTASDIHLILICLVQPEISHHYASYINATNYEQQ